MAQHQLPYGQDGEAEREERAAVVIAIRMSCSANGITPISRTTD